MKRPVRRSALLATAALVGSTAVAALIGGASPAGAVSSDDGGSSFTAAQSRLYDTRSSSPMVGGQMRTFQIAGVSPVPSSGVTAVALTMTIIDPASSGTMNVFASDATIPSPPPVTLTWSGAHDTESNTVMTGLGADGKIKVQVNGPSSSNIQIDLQGYYQQTGTSPNQSGIIPLPAPTRVADTRSGTSVPKAKLSNGSSVTVDLSGFSSVGDGATAIFANVTILGAAGTGWIRPYATGTSAPTTSNNFSAGNTSIGTSIDINDSKQFTLYVGAGGPFDMVIDVEAYFTTSAASATFHPLQSRIYDTRTTTSLAANETRTIPVTNVAGYPRMSAAIAGVALDLHVSGGQANAGLRAWPSTEAEQANAVVNYGADGATTNLALVRPGTDGAIKVHNVGNTALTLTIDAQGWIATPVALVQGSVIVGTTPIQGAQLVLRAMPNAATLSATADDDTVSLDPLVTATGVTDANGHYSLTPDLTAIPAGYAESDGTISFVVQVQANDLVGTWMMPGAAATPVASSNPADPSAIENPGDINGPIDPGDVDDSGASRLGASLASSSDDGGAPTDDATLAISGDHPDTVTFQMNSSQPTVTSAIAQAQSVDPANDSQTPSEPADPVQGGTNMPLSTSEAPTTSSAQASQPGTVSPHAQSRKNYCYTKAEGWINGVQVKWGWVGSYSGAPATLAQSVDASMDIGIAIDSGQGWTLGGTQHISKSNKRTKGYPFTVIVWNTVNFRHFTDYCDIGKPRHYVLPMQIAALQSQYQKTNLSSHWDDAWQQNHSNRQCVVDSPIQGQDSTWTKSQGRGSTVSVGATVQGVGVTAQSGWDKTTEIQWKIKQRSLFCGSTASGPYPSPKAQTEKVPS